MATPLPLCFPQSRIQEIKEVFDDFDSNCEGMLTIEQICDAMSQLGLQALVCQITDLVTELADTSEALALNFEQFLSLFMIYLC